MNKVRLIAPLLLSVLICCPMTVARAAQSIVLTDDVQMALGEAFMAERDYYRAITEYKKLVFLFPDSARLPEAFYQIGMAYYQGEDYESAVTNFAKVRETYAPGYFSRAAFYEGLSYEKLGRHEGAALAYERARLFDAQHEDAANAHVGLILNAAERGDTGKARSELSAYRSVYQDDERTSDIEPAFHLLEAYERQPRKDPALAGTLSALLPGSGQVYAEHYRDGLMAFVVNGLFIAGTVAAIDDENYALAGIIGGAGLPFYVGNIYGAARAARTWNLSLTRRLRSDLSVTLDFHF